MIRPLSDSNNQEILQAVLNELDDLRTRIDAIIKWVKISSVGPIDVIPKNTGPDNLFDEAVKIIQNYELASASLLQRKLKIGYARAARIIDELQEAGYVGETIGSKPREILKRA